MPDGAHVGIYLGETGWVRDGLVDGIHLGPVWVNQSAKKSRDLIFAGIVSVAIFYRVKHAVR